MKRIFSGVQPTNNIHIGNYFGAIKTWVEMQADNDCIFCVVDLHALTIYQEPQVFRQNIINVVKTYLALGIDPKKSIIFAQSDVKEHTELGWYLNTIAKVGELERMTQFKDKAKQHEENVNMGLFDYPVLMAADILLYNTNLVPVGEDQKQHIELARDLAQRFNKLYNETFVIPEPVINRTGARIMGLDDPTKKMSKSAASTANYIALLDDPELGAKKIMKAVTDSGSDVRTGEDKPAISNLLTIFALLSGKMVRDIEKEYNGKGYGEFKKDLSLEVKKFLSEFQDKFNAIDDNEVKSILADGAKRARFIAEKKIKDVKNKIGLLV